MKQKQSVPFLLAVLFAVSGVCNGKIPFEKKESDIPVTGNHKWNFELMNDGNISFHIALIAKEINGNYQTIEIEPYLNWGDSFRAMLDTTKPIYVVIFGSPLASLSDFLTKGNANGSFFERAINPEGKTVYLRLDGSGVKDVTMQPQKDSRWLSGVRPGKGSTKSQLSLDNNISESAISSDIPLELKKAPLMQKKQQTPVIQKAKTIKNPQPQVKSLEPLESTAVLHAQQVKQGTIEKNYAHIGYQVRSEKSAKVQNAAIPWRFELSNKSGKPIVVKILDKNRYLAVQEELKDKEKLRISDFDTTNLYVLIRRPGTIGKHDIVKQIRTDGRKTVYLTYENGILRPQKGGGLFGQEGMTESGLDNTNNLDTNSILDFDERNL